MVLSELREDLPVEGDTGLLQHGDELGVGETHFLEEDAHAHVPEAAEVALLVLPVSEGVSTSVEDSLSSLTFLGGAAEAVALHLSENILSSFEGVCAFLYSCHGI